MVGGGGGGGGEGGVGGGGGGGWQRTGWFGECGVEGGQCEVEANEGGSGVEQEGSEG